MKMLLDMPIIFTSFLTILLLFVQHGLSVQTCNRMLFKGASTDDVQFAQFAGVYKVTSKVWHDFPVMESEEIPGLFFYYYRPKGNFFFALSNDTTLGLGATGAYANIDASDLILEYDPDDGQHEPFKPLLDYWMQYNYTTSQNDLIGGSSRYDMTFICIDNVTDYLSCYSGVVTFSSKLIQTTNGVDSVVFDPSVDFYKAITTYKGVRPIYQRHTNGKPLDEYLYYSERYESWMVGPDYNKDEYWLKTAHGESSIDVEFITETWYIYTSGNLEAMPDLKLLCSGTQVNGTGCMQDICLNNGICVERTEEEILCMCPSGFTGATCEQTVDDICPPITKQDLDKLNAINSLTIGNSEGSVATIVCSSGYEPSFYHSVCTRVGSVGEWLHGEVCRKIVVLTTPGYEHSTTPQDHGGDGEGDGEEGSYEEPEWLTDVALGVILYLILGFPLTLFLILKVRADKKTDDDTSERNVDIQLIIRKYENKVEVLDRRRREMSQEEYKGYKTALEAERDEKIKQVDEDIKNKRIKRKVKKVSCCRISSLIYWVLFWLFMPLSPWCLLTKCGTFSTSLAVFSSIHLASLPLFFLWILLESCYSREYQYLRRLRKTESTGKAITAIHLSQPGVVWKVECYHWEQRTRIVYYKDSQGYTRSRTEIYYVKIVTHTDIRSFAYNFWQDVSEPLVKGIQKYKITRIGLDLDICAGDDETQAELLRQKQQFFNENKDRDTFIDFEQEVYLPGFKKRLATFTDEKVKPWWVKKKWFWISTLLMFTWPYRWIFTAKTGKTYYTVKKLMFLSRPNVPNSSSAIVEFMADKAQPQLAFVDETDDTRAAQEEQGKDNPGATEEIPLELTGITHQTV